MKLFDPSALKVGDVLHMPHRDFIVLAKDGNAFWLADIMGDVVCVPLSAFTQQFTTEKE